MDGSTVVAVAVGGLVFVLVARAFVRTPGPQSEVFEAWVRYCAKHHLRYVAPGMLLGERMPLIEGENFRLDLDETRSGDVRTLFTRILSRAESPEKVRFRCEARSMDLAESLKTLATFDTEFDEDYALTAEDEESAKIAARLMTEDVRAALVAIRGRRGVRLDYDRGEITLTWRGAEMDHATLDHARDAVLALARARPRTAGYR